jgi:IS30 family transposase
MAHAELSLRERRTIKDMLNAKIPVNKIAAEIDQHRVTVYREIKRNRFVDNELPKLNGYALKSRHEGNLRPPTNCDRRYGTPGKCPGWRTPTEAFREKLMELR